MTEYKILLPDSNYKFIIYSSHNDYIEPLVKLLNEHNTDYAAYAKGDKGRFAMVVGNRKFFEKFLSSPPFKITGWYSTGRGQFSFDYGIQIRETEKLPALIFDEEVVKLINSEHVHICTAKTSK